MGRRGVGRACGGRGAVGERGGVVRDAVTTERQAHETASSVSVEFEAVN